MAESNELSEELALEIEAVATAATQCFERVVAQTQTVRKLCAEMERDAAICRSWNRVLTQGAQSSEADTGSTNE
jgi:hypothetical protein